MTLTNAQSPYKIECDLIVMPGITLKVQEEVEIIIGIERSIYVYGELNCRGSSNGIIHLLPEQNSHPNAIMNFKPGSKGNFHFTSIINARIYADSSNIDCNNLSLTNNVNLTKPLIKSRYGIMKIDSSYFESNGTYEGVIIEFSDAKVTNSYFINMYDEIEFSGVSDGLIANNKCMNSLDDGIDVNGGENILIENNYIECAVSRGISIGSDFIEKPAQNIRVVKNIIASCNYGIAIKDSSSAILTNNTFSDNDTSIFIYQKSPNTSGGMCDISNTIISHSKTIDVKADKKSTVNISYSLCDTKLLEGESNIFADPLFVKAANGDFHLLPNSPCINTGDPNSPHDPDSTRADIGALYYDLKSIGVEKYNDTGAGIITFPNPASDMLFLKMKDDNVIIKKISICDIYGVEILFKHPINYNEITKLPINNFAPGVYILKVHTTNQEYRCKFAVIR